MIYKCRCLVGAVLVLQAVSLSAAGEVIVFDNTDGEFVWVGDAYQLPPEPETTYLDPTQPSTQSGEQSDTSLVNYFEPRGSSLEFNYYGFKTLGDIEIAAEDPITIRGESFEREHTPVRALQPGESVGSNTGWASDVLHFCYPCDPDPVDPENPSLPNLRSVTWLEAPAFIGFRTGTEGQYRYGWIELVEGCATPVPICNGLEYQPVRWAYETELNVPITVIPEPATWVLVTACGVPLSLGMWRRRLRVFPRWMSSN